MTFEIIRAADVPLADQATIVNAAFAGYVGGWTEMDASALARFLSLQGTDLCYSRFIRTSDGLAGFGYINRTGNILRLGAMALIPAARGTGAAAHLLLHLLEEGRSRRDAAMMLEVIEQNPRAVAFYRRHGFREIGRLRGWRRESTSDVVQGHAATEEIPILRALQMDCVRDYPEIPWSTARYAIARVEKTRAFRAKSACVVIGDPEAPTIRVHGLISNSYEWNELRAALAGVLMTFPDREFFAPPVWPENSGRRFSSRSASAANL